jgi:propanol-preferring alcohol dehydrogenase
MRATAICGSDLHPYRHADPSRFEVDYVPGHEPCGDIVAVGRDVTGWKVGDPAVVYFRRTCGHCHYCRSGHRNVCANRRTSYGHGGGANGSFAEYMAVEARSLMRKPEYLSYFEGAAISCQGGTAYYPLSRLGVSGRDLLVVSGLGPVGLFATMFARAMGARVVGIDPSAPRRALAAQLGAEMTFDPTAGPIGEQLRSHYPDGADKLIETSGSPAAHGTVGDLLKPLATAAMVGLGTPTFSMPLSHLAMRQLTVFGTSIYPDTQFEEICRFLRDHKISLESIVTHRFTLEDGAEAYRMAETATTGKVAFTFA